MKKHTFSIVFIFLTFSALGQNRRTVPFKIQIIEKQDTINEINSFYIIEKGDTVYPKVCDGFFKIKLHDSIADFYLHHKERLLSFKGLKSFRFIANCHWKIHINENASDSSFIIIGQQASCFSNVIVAEKNSEYFRYLDGKIKFTSLETNQIFLSYFSPRKLKRKNHNR